MTHFAANSLSLEVSNSGPREVFLYYADVWHPGWKARVNGQLVEVKRANLAYKLITLPLGMNRVDFVFDLPLTRWAEWLICAWSLILLVIIGILAGRILGFRRLCPVRSCHK